MSSLDDAIAKARAIAAKLSASVSTGGGGGAGAGGGGGSAGDYGGGGGGGGGAGGGGGGQKRARWGEANDDGQPRKKKKIFVPTDNPEFNFFSLLIGPRGMTQKRLQEQTGANINIRGKGTSKDGSSSGQPEDDEEMHVVIEGTEEQVEAATKEVENILYNPAEAMRLKQEQLRNLAEMKGGMMRSYGSGDRDRDHDRDGPARPGLGYDGHYGPRDGGGGGGGGGGEELEVEQMKIPNHVVGLVIGRGGESIQRITSSTGCFVQVVKEADMAPGETERTVNLKGSRESIDKARRILQEIVDSKTGGPPRGRSSLDAAGGGGAGGGGGVPDGSTYGLVHSLSVQVPSDRVGIIIGRQGSTIRGIQDRTGAHVQIPQPAPGDNPQFRTVNITASNLEHAQAAEAEVQALLAGDRGPPGAMRGGGAPPRDPWSQPGAQAMQLHVQNHHIGLIIGRGGQNIREIQHRTDTRISIPPQSAQPGASHRVVTITGPPQGQEAARYEIETRIMNEGCRDPMGNFLPYVPSPAFIVPIGPDGTPGGPPPPGYGPPPPAAGQDPYAAHYYQQQHQQPPPPDPARAPTPSSGNPHADAAPSPAPAQANGAGAAGAAASGGSAEETDTSQYHDQFWQYAAHYGQDYARKRYGVWAPPEGTPCPPHIRLPTPEEAAAAIAKAEAEGTA